MSVVGLRLPGCLDGTEESLTRRETYLCALALKPRGCLWYPACSAAWSRRLTPGCCPYLTVPPWSSESQECTAQRPRALPSSEQRRCPDKWYLPGAFSEWGELTGGKSPQAIPSPMGVTMRDQGLDRSASEHLGLAASDPWKGKMVWYTHS